MNTSFKANAAQHKAFIASVKKGFFFTKLSHLKLELASFWTEKYDWAINDVITFYTATGKYFVVKASDLLVSVDEANNATEPYPLSREEILAELKSAEIYQLQEETGYSRQEVIDLLDKAPERNSIGSLTEVDSPDDAFDTDNSLDDDSHLFYADNTVLVSADDDTDDEILRYKELAAPSRSDMFAIMHSYYERNLQAAKILFHYWALSGNSYPLPNKWNSLRDFVISNNGSIDIGSTLCPARKEYFRTKDLNINGKIFFLWELRELEESIGDDAAIDYSEDGFFQLLNNMVAVNYGVQSWFTQKDISVYQQNYQAIVADCEAIIALHEQAYKNADNGIGEYIAFPVDMVDLHHLVEYLNGTEAADDVVNSIKDEEYLFFQVLSTMNFINSTASTVEA